MSEKLTEAKSSTAHPSRRSSTGGRIWLASVGLFLAAAGGFFSWMLWKSYLRATETRDWTPTPCVVSISQVEEVPPGANTSTQFRAIVKYSYLINEEGHSSYRIKRQDARLDPDDPNNSNPKMSFVTKDKFKADEAVAKYPSGRNLVCFVNPDDPKEAVLEHGTKAGLYSIWFPLLFVAGGLGIFFNMLLPSAEDKKEKVARSSGNSAEPSPDSEA